MYKPTSRWYVISKSERPDKKLMVRLPDGKKIHFGSSDYSDFTLHKDPERKRLYLVRHGAPASREDWEDLTKAGTWTRWVLWSEPSIKQSIKTMERKFDIRIMLHP